MCIVCGPGGNRFLQAISTRYGEVGRQRFVAEEIVPENTPPLNPLDRDDLQGSADLILRGGPIITMRRPGDVVSAMALRAGRIQRVGDEDDVLPLRGRLTRLIDLEGRAVTPGFINAHWHAPLSLLCDWLDWIDPASSDAVLAAGRIDPGEWLIVRCAPKDKNARAAAMESLARIERPAALVDESCDILFKNAAAAAYPGAGAALSASACALPHVSQLLSQFAERLAISSRPLAARLRGAFEDLAHSGFTTVRLCGLGALMGQRDVDLVRAALDGASLLRLRGALDMRLVAGLANSGQNAGFGDDTFRVDAVTARIGDSETENAECIRLARECRARGWRVTLHAEGEVAIGAAVAGFAAMDHGPRPLTAADGLECRFGEGERAAVLSAQRGFSLGLTDGEPSETDASAVVRALEAADISFSISLDRMVGVAGPLESLSRSAGDRRANVSLVDRLPIVTAKAAQRCGADALLGTLEVGRYADLAFLDADPRLTPIGRSSEVHCVSTWVGGREIQRRTRDAHLESREVSAV
jgi:predicted amidohydrolase YtcJ